MANSQLLNPKRLLLVACLALAVGSFHAQSQTLGPPVLMVNLSDTPVALAVGPFHANSWFDWFYRKEFAVASFESVTVARDPDLKTSTTALAGGSAGFTVRSMVAGDFNRDGREDLALVGDASFGTVVLLGHGDGTFASSPVSSDFGYSIASADFNHDGIPDLAITGNLGAGSGGIYNSQAESVTVEVLLGTGTGSFQAGGTTPFTIYSSGKLVFSGLPYALATGDFNGDGKQDLAVTDAVSNTVVILLGNGDGTFTPGGTFPVGSSPLAIVAGDLNRDGKLDLAVVNTTDNTVTVLLGDGKGNFATLHNSSPIGVGTLPQGIAIGDFNGDGIPDLATANYVDGVHGTVTLLRGNGDGSFSRKADIVVGGGPVALVSGNFTDFGLGMGKDLAVANHAGYVQVLKGWF